MELENYKELFKECLDSFNFINPYIEMDAEFAKRDYNTLLKEKVSISEFKKKIKEEFAEYSVSTQYGGIYLRRKKGKLLLNFFFKFNGNIFLPYYEIFFNEEAFENLVNYSLTSGSSICRYLLNDYEYPMKAKIFANIEELIHITKNEILFFEDFIDVFLQRVTEMENK